MNTTASPENASLEALLSQITDEFLQRLDAGEQPDIEEYVQRYPALADVLRQVLPALTVLRQPPSTEEAPADGLVSGVLGDFRIVREVGRGGMGVVYEAEQISLGRRVALKVLPFAATMDARQLQRFHNEARAAAGLHQEHIVPVHAVGCERGIHFYAMQFIEGRTLAEWIEQQRAPGGGAGSEPTAAYTPPQGGDMTEATVEVRADRTPQPGMATSGPIGDRAYFRRVAEWGEQAAEALEYAHSVGIVHRDIKPANLMVDSHGKLWVTDFGLARTAADSGLTMTGDLLGTLRYMSPEQALAKHGLVDHRTDVYSLGVTLYELLTLRPAVDGKDRQEILQRIAFEDPAAPRSLNRAIPAELETIVLKAMAKEPAERYATAKELADDLRRFLEDKPVLARRPSLMQRTRRWSRRNRSLVGSLAAGLLLAAVALGGSVGWVVRDRAARQDEAERRVSEALAEMEPALRAGNPHAPELVRAARLVESHLAGNPVSAELRQQAEQLLADLTMLEELELIPLTAAGVKDGHFDLAPTDDAYADAFRRYGIDVQRLDSPEIGPRLHSRPIAEHLASALDQWALIRRGRGQDPQDLLRLAEEIDPQQAPWRKAVREEIAAGRGIARLKELAARAPVEQLPAASLRLLLVGLTEEMSKDAGLAKRFVSILQSGQRRFPSDFWLNHELAMTLTWLKPPRLEEALGFYRVVVALRPDSPGVRQNIGYALEKMGRLDEAIAEYREAIRLKKDYAEAHSHLGNALREKGQFDEAIAEFRETIRLKKDFAEAHNNLGEVLHNKGQLDDAIAEYREAIRIKKDLPQAHNNLGNALREKGQLDEAIAEFREAIRIKKDFAEAHNNLGGVLHNKGQLDDAIAALREAIRLKKDYAGFHYNLGVALRAKGQLDDAIAAYREAIRLKKDYAEAHLNLGTALYDKGQVDEAITEYREAIRIKKDFAEVHNNLGNALKDKGQLDEAIAEYREAIRIKKDNALVHYNLGILLQSMSRLDDAIAAYQEAIRIKPGYPEAHCNLGEVLEKKGLYAEALIHRRRGHELGSKNPRWPYPSAQWVQNCERRVKLDKKVPAILSGQEQPTDTSESLTLAVMCHLHKKRYAAAARFYGEAFAAEPRLTENLANGLRYNAACAGALAACGQGIDADKLDSKERTRLRRQALDWLRADLALWSQLLEKEPAKARPVVARQMQHWLKDSDFAGVRGADALDHLSESERRDWQQLWRDVEALRQRAASAASPGVKEPKSAKESPTPKP